tara:strand:- start:2454 stop:2927 length:474 start_codon:yes stop_codon:yes gene_type:complete
MKSDAVVSTLKTLKLHGMADAVKTLAEQSSPAYQQALPILDILLKAESSERDVRSINYQMKVAKFPVYRDLTGFDFAQSLVDESLVRSLHRCEFVEDAHNVYWWVAPEPAKRTWRQLSASRPYSTTGCEYGFSPLSSSSMHWSKRSRRGNRAAWQTG